MSQWDYGDGREPAEHPEADYPGQPRFLQQPADPYQDEQAAEYPYLPQPEDYDGRGSGSSPAPPGPQYGYPQPAQFPQYPPAQRPQYPPAQLPHDPDAQRPFDPYARPPIPYGMQPGQQPGATYPPDSASWADDEEGPADGYPTGGAPYDPPTGYPITYERDGFDGRTALPPDGRFGADPSPGRWRPPPPPPEDLSGFGQRRPWAPDGPPPLPDGRGYLGTGGAGHRGTPPSAGWRPDEGPGPGIGEPWPGGAQSWPGDEGEWFDERPNRGRWLIPAAVAIAGAAVGIAIVMVALDHSHAPATSRDSNTTPTSTFTPAADNSPAASAGAAASSGAASAPLTLIAARNVLSAYTAANNTANATRSAATLATVETGGSYAIDADLYPIQAAAGAAPYPAFTPVMTTYYIPQAEAAGGPRWFVVQVANAFAADPHKVTSTEYLLFTETATGSWRNAVEPYLLSAADAPQVPVGADGLATAVDVATTSLAIPPAQLAQQTAAAIDGTGTGVAVTDPAGLADRSDQGTWRSKLPTATVTDIHAPAIGTAGQTFALRTADGGALVFYTDAADLVITAPAGSTVSLTVPGLYSPAQALSRAGLSYLDQFAAVDPPSGAGTPRVIAQYSGLTGKD